MKAQTIKAGAMAPILPESVTLRLAMRSVNPVEPGKHCAMPGSGGFTRTGIWLDLIINRSK